MALWLVFGDLCRCNPLQWHKAHKAWWTRFCGQYFFNENRAQFYSYLVKRFWLGVALCSRKDFVQSAQLWNVGAIMGCKSSDLPGGIFSFAFPEILESPGESTT